MFCASAKALNSDSQPTCLHNTADAAARPATARAALALLHVHFATTGTEARQRFWALVDDTLDADPMGDAGAAGAGAAGANAGYIPAEFVLDGERDERLRME